MANININAMTEIDVCNALKNKFAEVYGTDLASTNSYMIVEGNYKGESVTMYRWNVKFDDGIHTPEYSTSGYIFQTAEGEYKAFNWYDSLEEYAEGEDDPDLDDLYDADNFDGAFDYACEAWS